MLNESSHITYTRMVEILPIKKGDILYVGSDILGLAKACRENHEKFECEKFIESLQRAVGIEGTLLFPTYNWDFCNGVPFDYHNTRGKTGALGTTALRMPEFKRTRHPLYSFAVWGKDREYLTGLDNVDAYVGESPFEYLYQNKAKCLLVGTDYTQGMTFIHYVERKVEAPYRFIKYFEGEYIDEDKGVRKRKCSFYARYLSFRSVERFNRVGKLMEEKGVSIVNEINGQRFTLVDLYESFMLIKNDIENNLCRNLYDFSIDREDAYGLGSTGREMFRLAKRLFPICRSITGNGVRETLGILQEVVPEMTTHEVPSGTEVFDWTVPKEWNIREAYIEDEQGNRIVDMKNNNLHVVGYSIPVNRTMSLDELKRYLYTLPEQPEWIPYVTSYYKERFGLCLSENQKNSLKEGTYHVVIDSELKDGSLTYGEIRIPGETKQEVFLSTYVCHPSMANNELSGPCVTIHLVKWLLSLPKRKYSYRIVFIPETIGSITYLSRHLEDMKENVVAGFNLSCVGDNRTYSYVASRAGDTLSDKVAKNVLSHVYPEYERYTFLDRGSDERQYNAPGVDLPVCAICRSKYGEYPEYHTSADNLDLISPEGLLGAYEAYRQCLLALEHNEKYRATCLCEPQLGKRGLYPAISKKGSAREAKSMMDFLAYADGERDLIDISDAIGVPVAHLIPIVEKLGKASLIQKREGG